MKGQKEDLQRSRH